MRVRSCRTERPLSGLQRSAFTLTLFLSVFIPQSAFAQATTGVIRGVVHDIETTEPLQQVNIRLLYLDGTSTGLGAATDEAGRYIILNIPPGSYTLLATMMGYASVEVDDLSVSTGRTTNFDITLEPVTLETGYIVTVTAGIDPLKRDVTSSRDSYTSSQMMDMPAYSTSDILNLQTNFLFENNFTHDIPGYYDRGLQQLHMRGGRNAEVAFMIDGMQITNLVFGGQAVQTNPSALEEMVIMASGMSAEFGNALSGVVNFVTRSGGPRFEGNVEILSSELSGHQQDDMRDMTRARGSLGGPVPKLPFLTFFVSGSVVTERDFLVEKDTIVYDLHVDPEDPSTRKDDVSYYQMPEDWREFDYSTDNPYAQRETVTGNDWRIYPTDIYAGWLGFGYNNNRETLANLTARIRPTMRLKASWIRNRTDRVPYTSNWRYSMFWGIPQEIQDNCIWGTERWNADTDLLDVPQSARIISSTGLTDFHNEKNIVTKAHDRLALIWTHQPSPSVFYTLRGSYLDYNRTMRVKRWVNEAGWVPRFEHRYEDNGTWRNAKWDPDDEMTQVTLEPVPYIASDNAADSGRRYGYFLLGSAGFGYDGSDRYFSNQYDITRQVKLDVTAQAGPHHMLKAGFQYKYLTLDQYDVQLLYLTPPYITQYRRGPAEAAFYIQDRIEYPHLVLNFGLRYDASTSGRVPFWRDPYWPIHENGELVIDPSDPETAPRHHTGRRREISPRIGLSHPLSERSVLYINYGHFYQIPVYRNMYIQGTLEDSVPLIGNPALESERSSKYEFGLRSHLDEIHVVSLVLWGKDTSNLVGSQRIPAFFMGAPNPHDYTVFVNYDYATARGVDLSISRRLRGHWSGRVNYSYLHARTNRDDPWSGYRGRHELDTSPKRSRPAKWDQPHTLSASMNLNLPAGSGPMIAGIRPLERLIVSLTWRGATGRPYTPATKEQSLELNSGRLPWTHRWDMRIYRDLHLFGLDCGLLAQVKNLFDRRNVQSVFSRTGKPDDPGPGATSYSENYDRSHFFGPRRSIDIGIQVRF